jgi:1-acyl-sn-glycerol-3-phosphate acyltransferase
MKNTASKSTEFLKNIFARIWALWGLISFVITFLIIIIPALITYLIPNPKGQFIFIKIAKVWMDVWLSLILCPLSVKGKEYFKKGETYIITFNHNTLLDVPITCPYIPGANKTIAKKSFARIPLFGLFYRKGSILVDRKNTSSRVKSYEEMKKTLASKIHMCIFPEGTRNRTKDPLKKFFDGAFKLSVDTKKAIIPTLLFNTNKAMPNNKIFYLLPHKLEMHFLEPVAPENFSSSDLKEIVFEIMQQYYLQHQ